MARIKCPICGTDVDYNKTNCERGHFLGFPNVRRALEMRVELRRHYQSALADAAGRGAAAQLEELERRLQRGVATINVDAKLLRNMAYGQNYMSYYKALEERARHIAEREYHAHRQAVDAKVHTGYETHILNAALSADGRGLTNYGPITLELISNAIENHASVMRENSFRFYERYRLGDRDGKEEPGWRSVWAERAQLGVAHLAASISVATPLNDLATLIMFSGADRPADRYIEVHLYNEVSWQSVRKVTLERPLTVQDDRDDWEEGRQKLSARVPVFEAVNP